MLTVTRHVPFVRVAKISTPKNDMSNRQWRHVHSAVALLMLMTHARSRPRRLAGGAAAAALRNDLARVTDNVACLCVSLTSNEASLFRDHDACMHAHLIRLVASVFCYNALQNMVKDIEHDKIFIKALEDPLYNKQGEAETENCAGAIHVSVHPLRSYRCLAVRLCPPTVSMEPRRV